MNQSEDGIVLMDLLLLALILVAAHTVETITGFGATVIALALGAHILPVDLLVVTLVLVAWIQSSWLVLRGFRFIEWRVLLHRILPLCILGLVAGAWCFKVLKGEALKYMLGIFVVLVSILELYRLDRTGVTGIRGLPSWAGIVLLTAGGFFHGLFASGGPLVVYYASRSLGDKRSFRVTLSVLWLILNTTLIVYYLLTAQLGERAPLLALILLPAVATGIFIGEFLHLLINETMFRKLVQIILCITGVSLLI